ncbi:iterative type I polyketide synthase [Aspergillus taichungensis]|uniref:Iterative type I polyketide synthase n=1 Tax=Aspergillus taichungensis TaxID=482145 RepID=A0A2J5HGM6_9EURO|nr:iterative type I polyketide synthase [Aspergillus taichungensis]
MGSINIRHGGDTSPLNMEPLAVVGMAFRGPQETTDTERLWDFLLRARQAMAPFPPERMNADAFWHPDPEHGGTFHNVGGNFLEEDPAHFDYTFFNIIKTELLTLDPQQRLVMENVYHALENAGLPMERIVGSKTGVYVTGFNHDHLAVLNADLESALKYKVTGVSNSIISNRLSWFFDFKGPSLTVDTACSSSMVALHLAAQSLRSCESDIAVVSGVNIMEYPADIIAESHHGFLSADAKCFSFDHRANGYSRGEGVASIIVKRLSSALRDGDTVRAVIRNTGVNQDGRTPGITNPSAVAQEALIRHVYREAGLNPKDTAFVEAHGTGTAAGDPVEASAIAKVFGASQEEAVYIGALKSNVGHLEGGSGVAAVIKAIYILENAMIPPNQNFEKINPRIPVGKWNIKFPLQNMSWPRKSGLRRVSVNSFGVGGTNAHCVMDDAYHFLQDSRLSGNHKTTPVIPAQHEIDRLISAAHARYQGLASDISSHESRTSTSDGLSEYELIGPNEREADSSGNALLYLLSAFDEEGISRVAADIRSYLIRKRRSETGGKTTDNLSGLAYTLSNKRSVLPWKSFVVAGSWGDLLKKLSDGVSKPLRSRNTPLVAFAFTGQGAQHFAMGRELLIYPTFRKSLEDATEYMKSLGSPWSLLDELLKDKEASRVHSPEIAHPSCVAVQVAIVDLLSSWAIFPTRVIGHSSGEIPAAYAAGKLSREAAWKVAYYRGKVSAKQLAAKGAMLAVGLNEEKLQPYVKKVREERAGELVIACYNSPNSQTVSGDEGLVDSLMADLVADGHFARKLRVQNAYHSSHMKEVAKEYLNHLGCLAGPSQNRPHEIHMFSSLTGKRVEATTLDAQYWVDNLVSPVRFTDGLAGLCLDPVSQGQGSLKVNSKVDKVFVDQIVEIGPHSTLQGPIKEIIMAKSVKSPVDYLPILNRNIPSIEVILGSVGKLYTRGCQIDIEIVNRAAQPTENAQPVMLTDLPPYPFNHSDKTLYISRLARNTRFRTAPRHDLLGAPVPDWNSQSPKWRHFFRLDELPWLRDHVVTDNFVYPGVGYLIMAIEAVKQLAESGSEILRFRFKNVAIKKALIIPDNKEGIETSISLTRMDETSLWGSSVWRRFEVLSYNPGGDDWIEHCTGYISVELKNQKELLGGDREAQEEAADWQTLWAEASQSCQVPMDFKKLYDNLQTAGLAFGPLFRNASNVKTGGHNEGIVTGTVTVPDISQVMPKNYLHPHLIHPATMDSMIHLLIGAVVDMNNNKGTLEKPAVPTFIREVTIAADIDSAPGTTFYGRGKAGLIAYEKFECDVKVWNGKTNQGCISIDGLRLTPLDSGDNSSTQARKLCHSLVWQPDVNFLDTESFLNLVEVPNSDDELDRFWNSRHQAAVLLMVTDALKELKDFPKDSLDGHLRRYYDWLEYQAEELHANRINGLPHTLWERMDRNPRLKGELYRSVEEHNAEGALAVRMGTNIVHVLKGEVDPLELMFGDGGNIMDQVYDYLATLGDLPGQLGQYLGFLGHTSPELRILEIGAGTGSSTALLLEALSPRSEGNSSTDSRIAHYCYTDVSASFFSKAKDRFKLWNDILDFRTLDIELNPATQNIEVGTYDIVVAGNVLHATSNLQETLKNVRALLRPGGRLVLQEGTRQDRLGPSLSFGQISGWWLGVEETRKWSPFVPPCEWEKHLRNAGFSGIDINMPQSRNIEYSNQSVFICSAVAGERDYGDQHREVKIISLSAPSETPLVSALKTQLHKNLGLTDIQVVHPLNLKDAPPADYKYIAVVELERPVLYGAVEEEYLSIRHLVATCGGLLWVTGDPDKQPEAGLINGLLRTVRWERDIEDTNLVPFAIIDKLEPNEQARVIERLFEHQFCSAYASERDRNSEYQYRRGIFYTNRLLDHAKANEFLSAQFSKPAPQLKRLGDIVHPIKLSIATPGLLSKLEWVADKVQSMPLEDTQVEVDIRAVGLNFRDVMIAMGEHMAYSLGSEGSGIVTRIGSGVREFKPGDRVVYMGGLASTGCLHTFGRVDQNILVKVPDEVSLEQAAGLPVVFATAIYGLEDIARLQKGETILIHAGAGGVGQAAIQYAQIVGAEIFATVSSPQKREILVEKYGILEDHIFSSRDLNFAPGVMRHTKGRGVDVILNSLSDEALRRSWDCLAPFGRFIEIGKKDAQAYGKVELTPFLRNVTMASVELPTMIKYRPDLVKRLTQDIIRLYAEGKIRDATPTTFMNYSQIEEGFRLLQAGKSLGKIIFVPHDDDLVPLIPEPTPPLQFPTNASYVLAGGLGGIGRSLALWMASRGARSLVFLSRSGKITEAVQKTLDQLEVNGCTVKIFKCDVSDKERMEAVVKECEASMPPIKGCIQCSMVLKDGMFENMSYTDWNGAVKPKAQGSWNLHELLPEDMDFFVLLSSATGIIGNRSQANYAAGNTYEDALARYRVSLGKPATSIDLGSVLSVGFVAENEEYARHTTAILEVLREDEIHGMLEFVIYSQMDASLTPEGAQLVTGLSTGAAYRQRGIPPPTYISYPMFRHLQSSSDSRGASSDEDPTQMVQGLLAAAATLEDAAEVVSTGICNKLAALLSIPAAHIEPTKSISSNGVDSLVAMEFRTWLSKSLGADIPLLEITGSNSIIVLSTKVARVSRYAQFSTETAPGDSQ